MCVCAREYKPQFRNYMTGSVCRAYDPPLFEPSVLCVLMAAWYQSYQYLGASVSWNEKSNDSEWLIQRHSQLQSLYKV